MWGEAVQAVGARPRALILQLLRSSPQQSWQPLAGPVFLPGLCNMFLASSFPDLLNVRYDLALTWPDWEEWGGMLS